MLKKIVLIAYILAVLVFPFLSFYTILRKNETLGSYEAGIVVFFFILSAFILYAMEGILVETFSKKELTDEERWELWWEEEMKKRKAMEEDNEHPSWIGDQYK